ncbi:MAG: spherulation-specific family 4 protein [Sulfuricurvum sp.]
MKRMIRLIIIAIVWGGYGWSEDTDVMVNRVFVGTLIPLYSYPGDAAWDKLIRTDTTLRRLAIINPQNGPVACDRPATADYRNGIAKLKESSVQVVGYVYTRYAHRPMEAVKADIDRYRECFSNLDGIFLDETNSSTQSAPYYARINAYIKESNGSQLTLLNPGVYPEEAIVRASDITVIYEDEGDRYGAITPPPYVAEYPSSRFALLGYGISEEGVSDAKIASLKTAKIGYVYLSEDGGDNPWDTLSGYFERLMERLKE